MSEQLELKTQALKEKAELQSPPKPTLSPDQVAKAGKLSFPHYLSEAQEMFLTQRTPKEFVKMVPGRGGKSYEYLDIRYVTRRLNTVFGFNWDFEVVSHELDFTHNEARVLGRLTVRTPSTTVVKTQFGKNLIDLYKQDQANGKKAGTPVCPTDDLKGAASDALKKCAQLLGIGIDLNNTEDVKEFDTVFPADTGNVERCENCGLDLKENEQAFYSHNPGKSKLCFDHCLHGTNGKAA